MVERLASSMLRYRRVLTSLVVCITLLLLFFIVCTRVLQTVQRSSDTPTSTPTAVRPVDTLSRSGPKIQNSNWVNERAKVQEAISHAWSGYKQFAFGRDELCPLSKSYKTSFGDTATTMIDALDTLWIAGMHEEFAEAREWIRANLFFHNVSTPVFLMEVTIRHLGGLLSAYDLSGDAIFLHKAYELGRSLLPAFNTSSGIPYGMVNLAKGVGLHGPLGGLLAEAGTVQVEMCALSKRTGDTSFAKSALRALHALVSAKKSRSIIPNGLYTNKIDVNGRFLAGGVITLGPTGDSFYEYLLKTARIEKNEHIMAIFNTSVDAIEKHLVRRTRNLTFLPNLYVKSDSLEPDANLHHLTRFYGAVLASSATTKTDLAEQITKTCFELYRQNRHGISPDSVDILTNGDLRPRERQYRLRPETVESIYYLYQRTQKEQYRHMAWQIFQSIRNHTFVATGGFAGIRDVTKEPVSLMDQMESFFLAETLKYLYLTFSDQQLFPSKRWIFNSEGHPLRL